MGDTISLGRSLSRSRESKYFMSVEDAITSTEKAETDDEEDNEDMEQARVYPSCALLTSKRLLDNLAPLAIVSVPLLPIDSIILCTTVVACAVAALLVDYKFNLYWRALGMPFVFPKLVAVAFFMAYGTCLGLLLTGIWSDHEFKQWSNAVNTGFTTFALSASLYLSETWNPLYAEVVEMLPPRALRALVELLEQPDEKTEFNELMNVGAWALARGNFWATCSVLLAGIPQVERYSAANFAFNEVIPGVVLIYYIFKPQIAIMQFFSAHKIWPPAVNAHAQTSDHLDRVELDVGATVQASSLNIFPTLLLAAQGSAACSDNGSLGPFSSKVDHK